MKKLILTSLVSLALASSPSVFAANSGKVTFTGKVIDTTCQLKTGDENKTVALPNVSKSAFSTTGDTAGDTGFTLSLTGCDSVSTSAGIRWKLDSKYVDTATGTLKNQIEHGQANDVTVQLVNENGTAVKIGGEDDTNTNYKDINTTTGSASDNATIPFVARYYATGSSVAAGQVQAIAEFSVVYK